MTMQLLCPSPLLLLLFLHCTQILAQSPAQPPVPAPLAATNITAILDKAGQFTTFIRLLKSTRVGDQLDTQLDNSNQGLTLFAPSDSAFSNLKAGTLNSLTDQQKVQLIQFHVLPSLFSMPQFQTASNPLNTQAGNNANGEFPLNITTTGNLVNISTGVDSATVASTLYTDNKLAVYSVDQVLLPMAIFATQSPAPGPLKPKKKASSPSAAPSGSSADASLDASGAAGHLYHHALSAVSVGAGIAVIAAFC